MALAGLRFVVHAVIFVVRNFTDTLLEAWITSSQVDVGRHEIEASGPDCTRVSHKHIAVRGFIAATVLATALAWYRVRRGAPWAYVTPSRSRW